MLTMNYIIKQEYSIDHILTKFDKAELLIENNEKDYSYYSLLREMLSYANVRVNDLFDGWGGIKLFKV